MMKFKNLFSELLSFVYPHKCICCKKIINNNLYICDECNKKIERIGDKICTWCGMKSKQCECRYYAYRFRNIVAPFINEGNIKKAFYDFKFNNRIYASRFFSEHMTDFVKKYYSDIKFDVICPVPMNYFDKLKRGYNQSEILAKELADILGVKFEKNLIYAHKKNINQHKTQSVKERFFNTRSRYYYKRRNNYENVLLVDDIKTTGATLDECARQLMLAGTNNVYCIAALVTVQKKKQKAITNLTK